MSSWWLRPGFDRTSRRGRTGRGCRCDPSSTPDPPGPTRSEPRRVRDQRAGRPAHDPVRCRLRPRLPRLGHPQQHRFARPPTSRPSTRSRGRRPSNAAAQTEFLGSVTRSPPASTARSRPAPGSDVPERHDHRFAGRRSRHVPLLADHAAHRQHHRRARSPSAPRRPSRSGAGRSRASRRRRAADARPNRSADAEPAPDWDPDPDALAASRRPSRAAPSRPARCPCQRLADEQAWAGTAAGFAASNLVFSPRSPPALHDQGSDLTGTSVPCTSAMTVTTSHAAAFRRAASSRRRNAGQALVEFAFVFPIITSCWRSASSTSAARSSTTTP